METKALNVSEITEEILKKDFMDGIPENATPVQLIARMVDFLKKQDNVFIKATTVKNLMVNPDPEVTEILNKVGQITKTGNTLKVVIPSEITYGKGLTKATINPNNHLEIKTLNNDLILMDMSGVTSGILTLSEMRITPAGIDVYTGWVVGWKNVVKF